MDQGIDQHTNHRRARQQGVTLIELLIGLFIIGLATSVVILNAPSADQRVQREAERLAARIKAASSEAIMSGDVVGMEPYAGGYQFVRFKAGDWVVIEDRIFSPWSFKDNISLSFTIDEAASLKENDRTISGRAIKTLKEEEKKTIPPIRFRPLGEDTPTTLFLVRGDTEWQVSLEAAGDVSISRSVKTRQNGRGR